MDVSIDRYFNAISRQGLRAEFPSGINFKVRFTNSQKKEIATRDRLDLGLYAASRFGAKSRSCTHQSLCVGLRCFRN